MADNQQYWPLAQKPETAKDIRRVIANVNRTKGKWLTIANTEELDEKKVSKENWLSNKNVVNTWWNVSWNTWLPTNKPAIVKNENLVKPVTVTTQPTKPVVQQVWPVQPTTNPKELFKNTQVNPVSDIEVINKEEPEKKTTDSWWITPYNFQNKLIKTEGDIKKDLSEGIEALYTDAYNKISDWEVLTLQDVLGNKKYQKQFDWVDEQRLQELINDANILAEDDNFDMANVLQIYDKYKDFWLLLDYNKLSPNSRIAYLEAVSSDENDRWLWDYVEKLNVWSPLYWWEKLMQLGYWLATWKNLNIKEKNQELRDYLWSKRHDFLSEEEIKKASADDVAKLDEEYKNYYTLDDKWNKKWNDFMKENEYILKEKKIQDEKLEQHWDSLPAVAKNAILNLLEVGSMAYDMVSRPWELIWWLASSAVWWVEKWVWYGWDLYDYFKNWKLEHKDITQHLAELWWYENYDEALLDAEYKLKDSPYKNLWMAVLNQIKTDTSSAWFFADYITEAYWSIPKYVESFLERPAETWSDTISVLEGWAYLGKKVWLLDSVKADMIIEWLWKLDPFEQAMKYGNKLNYWPVLKAETWVLKLWAKALKMPFKAVKNFWDIIVNKLSWLTEEERKFIRENPDEVEKFIKWDDTSQTLIDRIKDKFDDLTSDKKKEGEEYEKIKNTNQPINTKDLIEWIKEKLTTIWGKLTRNWIKLEKTITPALNNKVKELFTYIHDLQKRGKKATASDLHWLRQQLDSLANWDNVPKWLEATFTNMVKDIRRLVDGTLKDQVPWMREVDVKYSWIIKDINALKQDWFNKDGTLKDSAYSKIRNLTNKWANQPKLERLEMLIPWITKDLKALAAAESVEKAWNQMVWQYANQIWWVGGWITAITSLLTWWLSVPALILWLLGMQLATPKNLVSLLKFWWKIDWKINWVLDKISKWIKLTAWETEELARYLANNKNKLREKVEYMHEKWMISDEEYKAAKQKLWDEYDDAQRSSRNKAWDKEEKLSKEDEKAVVDWVKWNAKNAWFVLRFLDETWMKKALEEAWDKSWEVPQWFFYKKYINLLNNPTDTTVQHEFFHAVFSIVDSKTKDYLIQEARKILGNKKMDEVAAEEWLAESFGIYAKRKMIDTWLIKTPRSFENKLRNFFQKVYEWIQNFNWDRKAINKVFDEIYGWNAKVKDWWLDLSFLLKDKKVEPQWLESKWWLRKKSVYHGSPYDFDKFDSSHMGEWEWAQVHGWGHYVAVDKETAKRYANMRWNWEASYKWKTRQSIKDMAWLQTPEENMALWIMARMEEWWNSFEGARDSMIKDNEWYIKRLEQQIDKKDTSWYWSLDYMKEKLNEAKDEIEILNRLDKKDFSKTKRNLYTNDIPDPVKKDTPTGSNYLEEWVRNTDPDFREKFIKPEQVDKFVDALKNYDEVAWQKLADKMYYKSPVAPTMLWGDMYKELSRVLGSDKAASQFLNKIWYDGIHYYWWRDWEAYVIFNDDALKIKKHIRYKKKIWNKDVEINKDITSPDQMAKINSKGLSVIHDFISEKQAEKALDVSKDILDENGNAYLWTHTNKYNDKMFANFESTRDSKYATYSNADVAWFTNSLEMSKTYSANDSKLAPTKKFTNIDDFNKYAEKNKIDEWWKWDRYWDVKEIDKTTIAENNWQYIPYTTKTFEYKFNNLFDAYETFNDKWLMEGRWVDRLIWEMPKTEEEAYSKFEKYIKWFENWKVTNKWNKLKDLEASLDVDNIIWYFDNKDAALAEAYAKSTPSDDYHYQWVAQNLKKPYVVDYSSNKKPQMWNKLWTLKDFAKKEWWRELSKIFETMDKYQNEKWDILDFIDEWKKALLDKDNHYIDGNMIEDKDYFLGNIQQALRDWTVKLILDSPSWEWEEFAKIKNDIVANGKTFWDLHDMLKKISWTDDVFYSDFKAMWDLPTVLKDFWVPEATRTLIMQKLVDREFYKSAWISYADRIRIHWLADLEKKLNWIDLETNDYVRYALNDGNYDWVIFKNIIDYGGTPKEWWDSAKWWDVLTTFKSNQFKAWDNANPTDSKYISYKKKVSLDKKSEWLQRKETTWLIAKGRNRDGLRYKKDIRDLTLNNEKKEWAYDPRASLPKVRGWWTKTKIEKQLKVSLSAEQRWVRAALRAIQEFDSPEDFRAHTFYHWTQGSFVGKPSMSIPEKTFDRIADNFGWGYGQRYWAISLTTDKNIASRFWWASDHVNINPVILRKNANVIEMPNIHDSIELEDHIEKLWNDWVDAVWIWDKNAWEKELAVLNPRAIVNLDAPEHYRAYMLWSKENPLKIRTEEDFNRIYENAPKYRQELRESNNKYLWLKEKFFKDNYGESEFWLMDKDYWKYKEAKAEWENSKEKEEYEKGKMEYNRKIYETKDKIRFKKVATEPTPREDLEKVSNIKKYRWHLEEIFDNAWDDDYVIYRHNTKDKNVDSIIKDGLKTVGSQWWVDHPLEYQWELIRATKAENDVLSRDNWWFWGNEIYFRIKKSDAKKFRANDDEIMVPRNIKPEDIVAVNRIIDNGNNYEYWTKSFWFDYLDSAKKRYWDDPEVREKVNQIMPWYKKVWEEETGLRFKKKVDQTQTPEFKKWFEGSKVVDKSWKPLEVYHGSRHAWFTEFKPVNSFEDWLYFFSNKRHIASYFWWWDTLWSDKWLQGKFDEAKAKWIDEVKKFAKRYFNTPQEIEVSMNHITPKEAKEFWVEPWYFYHMDDWQVSSPIRINWKRTFDKPLSQKEIDDAILREVQHSVDFYWAEDKKKSQVYASYLDIKNPLEIEAKWNKFSHVLNPIDWQYHHVADIAYMAKENWYDWVIIKDVSESPERDLRWDDYIVWDSRQIKSATDNIWTFDKNNPDIRYKKWLEKKESWLEKKDVRYKLNTKWFTPWTRLTTKDFDEMKTRNISFIKTKDWTNWKDTLRRVKNKIQQDLWINVIDWMRITSSSINHVYNSHWYDTELWYWKSVTKQDLTKIPDILENYSTISNTTDSNGNPTNNFILTKDYGWDRYNLVIEVVNLNNWWKQIWLKTFYINDAQWRAKFAQDKRNWVVKNNRKKAKQQYWGRINL